MPIHVRRNKFVIYLPVWMGWSLGFRVQGKAHLDILGLAAARLHARIHLVLYAGGSAHLAARRGLLRPLQRLVDARRPLGVLLREQYVPAVAYG